MGGGDPPFENRELIVSQRKIIRFWWHLVYNTIFGTRWQSRVQIKTFLKFKMADGRHFKHRFLAITQQPIARFEWNFAFGSSFSQNFGNGTDINFLQNVFFCFPNAIWASASGSFRIVSDTLVVLPNLTQKWYGSCRAVRTDGAAHEIISLLTRLCIYYLFINKITGKRLQLSWPSRNFQLRATIILYYARWQHKNKHTAAKKWKKYTKHRRTIQNNKSELEYSPN